MPNKVSLGYRREIKSLKITAAKQRGDVLLGFYVAQWGDLGEGASVKEVPLSMSGVISPLMIGMGVHSVLGDATPGQVVLCCVRKQVEPASKQHSFISST